MAHIRLLKNVNLLLVKDNEAKTISYSVGKYIPISKLVRNLDGTVDIHTQDGWVAEEVLETVFSVQGVPVIEYKKEPVKIEPPNPMVINELLSEELPKTNELLSEELDEPEDE